jgi:hypothetical protein
MTSASGGAGGIAAPSPQQARAAAKRILAGSRYHSHPLPRPLHGVLHTLGSWLDTIFSPVGRFIAHFFSAVGPVWGGLIAFALLVGVAAVGSLLLIRRRERTGGLSKRNVSGAFKPEDPDDLDQLAGEAESSGDLSAAIRMRFRAGLIRLARRGYIDQQDTRTSSDLSAALVSNRFDRLAHDLEEIVYASRPASGEDVATAREFWPRVLDDAATHAHN